MEATLRLEGFSESLRGRRSYCVSSTVAHARQFIKGRLAGLDTELAHRGRKVLIFQGAVAPPKWLTQIGWDATFHARDIQDLKLALTYIQNAVRPIRVVWAGGDPSPSAMNLLVKMDITLICLGEKAPTSPEWQAIFWPSEATQDDVEPTVVARIGHTGVTGLRSVLKELRGSQVGLVWSSIEESDKHGALYWYDPAESTDSEQIDLVEAATTLTELAAYLRK